MGSIAVTDCVVGRRAADSAKMPPPQPMSRYRSFEDVSVEMDGGIPFRQRVIKVCRSGFMRCSSRDGPTGSHQLDASALKWETSVGSTEDLGGSGAAEELVEENRGAGNAAMGGATRTFRRGLNRQAMGGVYIVCRDGSALKGFMVSIAVRLKKLQLKSQKRRVTH